MGSTMRTPRKILSPRILSDRFARAFLTCHDDVGEFIKEDVLELQVAVNNISSYKNLGVVKSEGEWR